MIASDTVAGGAARLADLPSIDLSTLDLSDLDLSFIDRIALWYAGLPEGLRTLLTVAVGAAVAYAAFRIVYRLIRGMVKAAIAAVLAFLLTTVPGNLILAQAFDRVEERIGTHLNISGAVGGTNPLRSWTRLLR